MLAPATPSLRNTCVAASRIARRFRADLGARRVSAGPVDDRDSVGGFVLALAMSFAGGFGLCDYYTV
jgi:hypothetical protein